MVPVKPAFSDRDHNIHRFVIWGIFKGNLCCNPAPIMELRPGNGQLPLIVLQAKAQRDFVTLKNSLPIRGIARQADAFA